MAKQTYNRTPGRVYRGCQVLFGSAILLTAGYVGSSGEKMPIIFLPILALGIVWAEISGRADDQPKMIATNWTIFAVMGYFIYRSEQNRHVREAAMAAERGDGAAAYRQIEAQSQQRQISDLQQQMSRIADLHTRDGYNNPWRNS